MAAWLTAREVRLVLGGTGAGALLGGSSAYLYLRRNLELKYGQVAKEEIDQMRGYFQEKDAERRREFFHVGEVVETGLVEKPSLDDVVANYTGTKPIREAREATLPVAYHAISTPTPIVENVFEVEEDVWDFKVEMDKRDTAKPYIIHRLEFQEQEDYEQVTLTYWKGDDVLCDQRDAPVDARDAMVGDDNLEHFGHGSEDPNVLYIRNEVLEMDFEIVMSDGHFAHEVHGIPPEEGELQHSAMRRRIPRGFSGE